MPARRDWSREMKHIMTVAFILTLTAIAAAQAPPAVTKAFQQTYPGATVSATAEQREGSRTLYRVEGVYQGKRRIVLYDANGTAIEVAEPVDEKELPAPVAAAMHSHPRAIYGSGLKVTRGGSVEYRLTVRGTRKTAMVAKPDGTVVSFK
jgi:hypothetical protein